MTRNDIAAVVACGRGALDCRSTAATPLALSAAAVMPASHCALLIPLLIAARLAAAEALHEAERVTLEQHLLDNTSRLQEAFAARDAEAERGLYDERMRILHALRALRPRSNEPPIVYEGVVEQVRPAAIALHTGNNSGLNLRIGRIGDPAVQQEYAAIDIGDRVRLVYTHEPDLLNDDAYGYELTAIRRTGRPVRRVALMSQDVQEDVLFEASYALLHHHPRDELVSVLVTMKNRTGRAIDFHGDPFFTLQIVEGNRRLDHRVVHGTASIAPGDIGIILLQVRRADLQGRHFNIRMTHQRASFSTGGSIELPEAAD